MHPNSKTSFAVMLRTVVCDGVKNVVRCSQISGNKEKVGKIYGNDVPKFRGTGEQGNGEQGNRGTGEFFYQHFHPYHHDSPFHLIHINLTV